MVSQNCGISIIVPTFNRASYLPSCLDSILGEMSPADELLVVNDGSTDQTETVLGRYADRLRFISVPNGGKAAAMNLALEKTDRPFVWIVDDDDKIAPGARERLMDLFREDSRADFAYGRHLRFRIEDEGDPLVFDTGHWVDCEADGFLIATLEDMFVHQPGMIVRRALYERVGPFDRQLNRSVDYEMLIRLAVSGRAASTQDVVFYQRQHSGARGSAAERIAPDQRERSWLAYDETIFRRLHTHLPLSVYVPSRRLDGARDDRQALLQRGTIMMRKNLWDLALADFHLAADRGSEPLSLAERQTVLRAFSSKYGCDTLLSSQAFFRNVAELAQRSPFGRQLALVLARGLFWRIRHAFATSRALDGADYIVAVARLGLASTGILAGSGRAGSSRADEV